MLILGRYRASPIAQPNDKDDVPLLCDQFGRLYVKGLGTSGAQTVEGVDDDGAAKTGKPVLIAGYDGALVQALLSDAIGRLVVAGGAAEGAAKAGNPVPISGIDPGNLVRALLMDTGGRPRVVGSGATGAAVVSDPLRVGFSDGANTRDALSDTGGRLGVYLKSLSGQSGADGINPNYLTDAAGSANLAVVSTLQGYVGSSAWDRLRLANIYKTLSRASIAAAGNSTIWTPAAGKKPRLMGGIITVSAAFIGSIRFGTAGSGVVKIPLETSSALTIMIGPMDNGLIATNANDVIEVNNASAGAVSVAAVLWGLEE